MENTFFLPIDSVSLAHYFNKAIILPAQYFTNKPEDIQNRFPSSLLLSKKKWIENSDCSVEIILTDEEIKELQIVSNHFFIFNNPIPISRIKSVSFLNQKQKETTIWNINNGAAFIPERIVGVENQKNIEVLSINEIDYDNKSKVLSEMSDKIKRFDIILGGFAFMKVGGKSFMNYSENYFSTLSYFNKLIEEQTLKASKNNGLNLSSKYNGLFSKNESEWTRWLQYIYQNIDTQDIQALAEKEGIHIEKKLGLLKIETISPQSHLYELAILATYGDRKNKSTDNLVTDLSNGTIFEEKVEDVSILFGLNNGYSNLRNKYKGLSNDAFVKFTLESKLDYYTIESIYQFVFNNKKKCHKFDYIDEWCPTTKLKEIPNEFVTYKILDTIIIAKKKETPLEYFLENYSPEIYSIILNSIKQWLPPFTKIDENEAIIFFKNQLRNQLFISIEAVQNKIEIEYESNFSLQKKEIVDSYELEIVKLLAEISNLKEANEKIQNRNSLTRDLELQEVHLQNNDNVDDLYVGESVSDFKDPLNEITINFESMNLPELKAIAKAKNLKGFSKKSKEELVVLLNDDKKRLTFL